MWAKTWTLTCFILEHMWPLGFMGSKYASQSHNNNWGQANWVKYSNLEDKLANQFQWCLQFSKSDSDFDVWKWELLGCIHYM